MGTAASVRAFISKAVLCTQEVRVEGGGVKPLSHRIGAQSSSLRDVWIVFLSLDSAANTKGMPLCPCFGPPLLPAPPLLSLVCGTPTPGQADRAPVLYLSDCGRLLPLIPLIHVSSARTASLRKSNLFSNYERRWA